MLITEIGDRDQIAVLEDRVLVEHYITRAGARSMVGNIYLGKVQNVLPGMEAAFVDVGRGRNAVLYAGEVSYDEDIEGHAPRIEQVLRSGQNVMVQVTKDPIGGKGARLTQQVSLPGRYVVLVPHSQVFGISRRLPDKERQRLKDILKRIKPVDDGLIVRTAAEGADGSDLEADLARLIEEWKQIEKSGKKASPPAALRGARADHPRGPGPVHGGRVQGDRHRLDPVFDQVVAYLQGVAPELVGKVHMHEGPLPMFETYHATEQIHKALDRKVWLPSGGYLVIDTTEAMTVVDVNTGKHVGKANLEETVTKTNLEAAEETARQLRLRDIGGMIIIDFIDMLLEKNKEKVISTMKNAMAQDKTRSQVFDIGPLGLPGGHPQAGVGGAPRVLLRDLSHLRGAGDPHHPQAVGGGRPPGRPLPWWPPRLGATQVSTGANRMYAVIKTGGKQHRVKAGDVLEIELVREADSGQVTFTPLLVVDDEGKTHVGKDLGKAQVTAKVLGEQKGDKVKIFKYRPKTGYARHQGHRQRYTLIEIEDVSLSGSRRAAAKKAEPLEGRGRAAPKAEAEPAAKAERAVKAEPAPKAAEAAPTAAAEPEARRAGGCRGRARPPRVRPPRRPAPERASATLDRRWHTRRAAAHPATGATPSPNGSG